MCLWAVNADCSLLEHQCAQVHVCSARISCVDTPRSWQHMIRDITPLSLNASGQFEVVSDLSQKDNLAGRAAKSRSKVIQKDEEEVEWDQDQLDNIGSDGSPSYEVRGRTGSTPLALLSSVLIGETGWGNGAVID